MKLAKDNFVCVAVPGMTDNTTLVLSASGKKLSQDARPDGAMQLALKAWPTLTDADKKPKTLPDLGYPDPTAPPFNGLVLKATSRCLLRDAAGKLRRAEKMMVGDGGYSWNAEPQFDYVWFTEAEWKSLIPASPAKGMTHQVPAALVERIGTFHLLDKGLGTPDFFWPSAKGEMTLTVEDAAAGGVRMKLDGTIDVQPGYPVRFRGQVAYDPKLQAITKFEMVALGKDDGDTRTPEQRGYSRALRYDLPRGCVPLMGVLFERVSGTATLERVPPYALLFDSDKSYNRPYFSKGK